jgi:hypothetical protein
MNKIKLTSVAYKIARIKKKTRARVFEDFREGDIIRFVMLIEHAGRASGGGCYASTVTVENVTQGTSVAKTQSELTNLLRVIFEIEPVGEAAV